MNKLILTTISTLLTFNISFAEEADTTPQVMRMVCMKTYSTVDGGGYTGKVYVIEQVDPHTHDGSVFSDRIPRQEGQVLLTSEQIPFRVTMFPQVNGLRGVEDFEALGNDLLATANQRRSSVVESLGYRMHMGGDHHFFFSLNDSGSDYIKHYVDSPEATSYQHGDDGGLMRCQTPYTVAFNPAPTILNEEQVSEEVLASNFVAE